MNQLLALEELSSDSDSDTELINFIIFDDEDECFCELCRPRIPRVQNFIENVVEHYTEEQFQENFRLCRPTFEYLLLLLRPDLENMEGRRRISAEKHLYVTLWFLGTPDSYRSVTSRFGICLATAWSMVNRVVEALCKLRSYFIRWPTPDECISTAERIQQVRLISGVIGAVDGTHVRIPAPKEHHEAYINRKGYHSIQLQVTCNDDLEFIHCYTGMPGSVHDARVFRYSGLQDRCNDQYFPNDCHLLADSAYTLQRQVIVPYRDNGHLTIEQTYFNKKLSGARMMVERSIGLLKGRWRLLLDKIPMQRTDLIPYYIMACCVLHNICLKLEDTFEYPIVVPETHDTDEPLDATNADKVAGNIKRNNMCEAMNDI